MHRRTFLAAAAATPLALTATRLRAAEPEIFAIDGTAIRGIDPVAYFDAAAPVEGVDALMWKGVEWRFATPENRAAFEMDPMRWAPAFGGYCAYAASLGYLAPTVPEAWTVHEGRLYLNANLRARELWLADIDGNIAKGEANWPGILG